MSFPRAKLQRFNETQNYTPSPADYNVSTKSHVSGTIILKTERFIEPKPSSVSDLSVTSHNSGPTFRTPNLPRRFKPQQHSEGSKVAPINLFDKADKLEQLQEKIVECNNKDLYIQELTEQLEEMKLQLSNMEREIERLQNYKEKLEGDLELLKDDCQESKANLKRKHEVEFVKLNEQIGNLNMKIDVMKKEYLDMRDENKKVLEDLLRQISTLEQLNDKLGESYNVLMQQKAKEIELKEKEVLQLEQDILNIKTDHNDEIIKITKTYQEKIQNNEFEMLETVTEIQQSLDTEKEKYNQDIKKMLQVKENELNNLRVEFNKEKLKLHEEAEAKYKQMVENYKEANVLAEIQMKEKCNDIEMSWKLQLIEAKDEASAVLKECQEIAEYAVIECELEKNKAVCDLNENKTLLNQAKAENTMLVKKNEDLEEKCKNLQGKLSNVIIELNEFREISAKKVIALKDSIESLMKDKHTFEVTIRKTHATVEMLKKRLMRSDQDVEQLKAELEATEETKLQFEGRCGTLVDELVIVCGLCDDLEEQNKLALCIAEEKVNKLEHQLLQKVDEFKQQAKEEIDALADELTRTKTELNLALTHAHDQQNLNEQAQALIKESQDKMLHHEQVANGYVNQINNLEAAFENVNIVLCASRERELNQSKINESLIFENKTLKEKIEQLKMAKKDLSDEVETVSDTCHILIEHEQEDGRNLQLEYDRLKNEYHGLLSKCDIANKQNVTLRNKIDELEALIGPFGEHLKAYEMEYNALVNEKSDAEKEAKEMGLKYAQILGHQNQKQKIKHLVDLKTKNIELATDKKELQVQLRKQACTIEKLKKDLICANINSPKKLLQQDKENIASPNRTLNANHIESPSCPLRNRN